MVLMPAASAMTPDTMKMVFSPDANAEWIAVDAACRWSRGRLARTCWPCPPLMAAAMRPELSPGWPLSADATRTGRSMPSTAIPNANPS